MLQSTATRRWWRSPATVGVLIIFLFPLALLAIGWSLRDLPGLPKPQLRRGRIPEAHWVQRAALAAPRDNFGIATVDGRVWALGGATGAGGGRLDTVEIYEPTTDTWAAGPRLTSARSDFGAVAVGPVVYAIGGATAQAAESNLAEALDTTTGRWRALPPLPTPRAGHTVVALNGQIYAIGGSSGGKETGAVEVYDPQANTWRQVAPLPTPRANLAAVALNGKLAAFGGTQGGSPSALMDIYDPATDRWTAGPPLIVPVASAEATVLDGRVYALSLRGNQVYDPRSNKWIAATEMPTSRQGQGLGTVGETFYAVGGLAEDGRGALGVVEAYVLGPEDEVDTFRTIGYNPAGAAAVFLGLIVTVVLITTMLLVSRRRLRARAAEDEGA